MCIVRAIKEKEEFRVITSNFSGDFTQWNYILHNLIQFSIKLLLFIAVEDDIEKQSFADVFQNRCFWKFCNIHRKTPNSVETTLLKRDSSTGVFMRIFAQFLRTAFLQNISTGCFWPSTLFSNAALFNFLQFPSFLCWPIGSSYRITCVFRCVYIFLDHKYWKKMSTKQRRNTNKRKTSF